MTTVHHTASGPTTGPGRARQAIGAYVAFTKPRIIELLLVTTVPAMVIAERLPSPGWCWPT